MNRQHLLVVSSFLAVAPSFASASALGDLLALAPAGAAEVTVASVRGGPTTEAALQLATAADASGVQRYTSPATYRSEASVVAAMNSRAASLAAGGYIVLEKDILEYGCGGDASPFDMCYAYWIDFIASVRRTAEGPAVLTRVSRTLEGGRLVETSDRRFDTHYEAQQTMERVSEELVRGGFVIYRARVLAGTDGYRYRIEFDHNPL